MELQGDETSVALEDRAADHHHRRLHVSHVFYKYEVSACGTDQEVRADYLQPLRRGGGPWQLQTERESDQSKGGDRV